MLALAGVVLVLVLLPLVRFRLERDQAHFAYLAQTWLAGYLPYADNVTQQWPGQLLIFAAVFKVFGQSAVALRAVDLVLQMVAGLSLIVLAAALARPLTGLVTAVLVAMAYVLLGPWDTTNRETFQVVVLLPILAWLLLSDARGIADRIFAACAGAGVALAILIKPTFGLVLPPLLWMLVSPPVPGAAARRWSRLGIASLGALAVLVLTFVLLRRALPAAYEQVIAYNVQVYAQLSSGVTRPGMVLDLLKSGLFVIPIVIILLPPARRQIALRLAAVQVALVCDVVLQGKAFQYHLFATVPLMLLFYVVLIDLLVRRLVESTGSRRLRWIAVVLIALCLPRGPIAPLSAYAAALADDNSTLSRGQYADIWAATADWMDRHIRCEDGVFIFGMDQGVQWLKALPPLSPASAGVMDPSDPVATRPPLSSKLRRRLVEDLERRRPLWILVAAYDASWLTKSGVDSLLASPELLELMKRSYVRVQNSPPYYVAFKRNG
jgi:hypothetical protein